MQDSNDADSGASSGPYIRKDSQNIEALPEDIDLEKIYSDWPDKGPVIDGRRITIMAIKPAYRVNEEVRIIHVLEALSPGSEIYLMGPKAVVGEYVDGQLQGEDVSVDESDPFEPEEYDGRVQEGPATDLNFEVTVYTFTRPGLYQISWQPGKWKSNILEIEVNE